MFSSKCAISLLCFFYLSQTSEMRRRLVASTRTIPSSDSSRVPLTVAVVIRLKALQKKEDEVLRFIQQNRFVPSNVHRFQQKGLHCSTTEVLTLFSEKMISNHWRLWSKSWRPIWKTSKPDVPRTQTKGTQTRLCHFHLRSKRSEAMRMN